VDFGCHDPHTLCLLTFVCGFLKQGVYCNNPRHLENLEHNIQQAVAGTDQQTLREGAKNSMKRENAGLQKDGGYFQHLLYLHFTIRFLVSLEKIKYK
jgi:hypothetical protein